MLNIVILVYDAMVLNERHFCSFFICDTMIMISQTENIYLSVART